MRFAASLLLAVSLLGQVSVLTQHNDIARTGTNLQETVLTPANVNQRQFGKLATRIVDGNIYAQPLIAAAVNVLGRASPTDLAIVATEHNSVYAFDAADVNPNSANAQIWRTSLGPSVESIELARDIGRPECVDLTTEIGITGTPAIHLANGEGEIFVAAKSKKNGNYSYTLFALQLSSGKILGKLAIGGSVPGKGNGSQAGKLQFNPKLQLNRPALLLSNGIVYVAFGGHCDVGPYHGWLFAYNVSNPKSMRGVGIFCTTPGSTGELPESRAGIWMSGQGPAADASGSVYVVTGDGTHNGLTEFGNSVVKLKLHGKHFEVEDWFAPENHELLKQRDLDLGSGGPTLIPASDRLLTGGKEGRLYLLDGAHLGRGTSAPLQSFQVTHGPKSKVYYNLHGGPIVWAQANGAEVFAYTMGEEDPLKQYRLIPDGVTGWKFASDRPYKTAKETAPYPHAPEGLFEETEREQVWMPGGSLSLSANAGQQNSGILWAASPLGGNANESVVPGILRAFNASDVSAGELWNSESTGRTRDKLGQFAKFCPPTVANGKVYVATFQQESIGEDKVHRISSSGDRPALVIYGLLQ